MLIDSGAKGASYIDKRFTKKENIPLHKLRKATSILNVNGMLNQGGSIEKYAKVTVLVQGQTSSVPLLVMTLGQETVILGYPWLRQENLIIDWRAQTITWRQEEPHHINGQETFEDINEDSLVISTITEKMTNDARQDWMKTRMSHSQLFALEEEKAKM